MQPLLAKSSLLISLCLLLGTPGYAQKSSVVKRKLAMAPAASAAMPLPAVRARGAQAKVPPPPLSKLNKLADTSYPQSHLQKGFYFKQKGQTNEALLEFIRAAQENPRDIRAFYQQAQLFKQSGKIKLAKSALEQALAVSPGNTEARSFLVQLHFESGNLLGAAAEVGKMFTLNQSLPAKPKTEPKSVEASTGYLATPSSAATHIANLSTPDSASIDATSAWLAQAASPSESNKASQTNASLNEVMAHIGTPSDGARSNSASVPQIHSGEEAQLKAQAEKSSPAKITNESSAETGRTKSAQTVQTGSEPGAESGLFSRVRSGATRAITGLAKPVPVWVKIHLPLAGARAQKDDTATDNGKQSRAVAAVTWMKDKVPFIANKPKAVDTAASEKASRTTAVLEWMKDKIPFVAKDKDEAANNSAADSPGKIASLLNGMKDKLPFKQNSAKQTVPNTGVKSQPLSLFAQNIREHFPFMHQKSAMPPNTVVRTVNESSPAEKKNELPPAIAKALEGKFNGQASISGRAQGPDQNSHNIQLDKDKLIDQQIKQVLASVASPASEKETQKPVVSGPVYGLLKNNALSHIGTTDPPEMADQQPSFLDNIMKQAGKTFSQILPSISWSWPSLPSIPGFKSPANSPAALVASVPVLKPESTIPDNDSSRAKKSAPTPVPLDVTRILNRFAAPASPGAAPPTLERLSASLPVAAAPATIDELIPKPSPVAAQASVATMQPQALTPSVQASVVGPHSSPQSLPQALQFQVPPIVQSAIDQAQPVIKPALDAASNLVQSFAPLAIPKQDSLPEPVQSNWAAKPENNVPVPNSVDMQKYFPNLAIVPSTTVAETQVEGQSAGVARKLIDMQKGKSGAFTFMKPLIDSDRAYMMGARQVRTIQPLPAKAEAKPAPVAEDPITKRMRYILEHGTGNLRKGEAFMFSEETGEGTLFLPDGSSERRKLQEAEEADKVMRARRPDIIAPKDLQYTLSLLGKLLPPQAQNNNGQNEPVNGPTLDQLMNQMNQSSKGFFGWMKKSLNINN